MPSSTAVKGLVDTRIVSVAPEAKVSTVLKVLEDYNLQFVPVLDNGRLVGIANIEALRKNPIDAETIEKLMLKPIFVEESSSIDYAIKYIMEHGIGRVPVVESSIGMRCIGVVTASALLKAKKSQMQ